jgi:hypothetical protein
MSAEAAPLQALGSGALQEGATRSIEDEDDCRRAAAAPS